MKACYFTRHHLLLHYIASDLRKQFLEVLSTVQLLVSLSYDVLNSPTCQPAISCTFACHKNCKPICAMRPASLLAQWLKFTLLVSSMQCVLLILHIINVFQMTGLFRQSILLQRARDNVSLHLPE